MDLFAVAAPVSLLEESRDMLRKAGLRMTKAAPAVCSYMSLIRGLEKRSLKGNTEFWIWDISLSECISLRGTVIWSAVFWRQAYLRWMR